VSLGYDLGRSGVDGVFLGQTQEAVSSFQRGRGLTEDGLVGDETWAALVDATFTLGVLVLQNALNALGFACGEVPDGIFGAYTERAVRDFQASLALGADGIVGDDTVRALVNLRHVWEGKDTRAHSAARPEPARSCDALARHEVALVVSDAFSAEVADRFLNLALANTGSARVSVVEHDRRAASDARITLVLSASGTAPAPADGGAVRVSARDDAAGCDQLLSALAGAREAPVTVRIVVDAPASIDERAVQRVAVLLLDAVCSALD
jgi:hypothetical protein